MLKRLAELVPAAFLAKTLALTATGLIVIACVYWELFSRSWPGQTVLALALLYPLLFLSAYLYLSIIYPLREATTYPHTQQHPLLLLLSVLNYLCVISLLHASIPSSHNPQVIIFLLALPSASTAGLLLWQSVSVMILSNLLAAWLLIPYVETSFFLQIASSQVLVYLLFSTLINEFRQKTVANINLAQLRATQRLLEAKVKQETTERIAHDLHDELGHLSTVISNNLNQYCHINQCSDPLLENAKQQTQKMSEQIRLISSTWQMPALDIKAALTELAANIPRPNVKVDIDGFDGLCSASNGETLYRCCQEIITNSIKHSNASTVHIMILKNPTQFSASIEDNGRGKTRLKLGNGLNGIRSRVIRVGGDINMELTPDGFRAQLTIPAT